MRSFYLLVCVSLALSAYSRSVTNPVRVLSMRVASYRHPSPAKDVELEKKDLFPVMDWAYLHG